MCSGDSVFPLMVIPVVRSSRGCGVLDVDQLLDWANHVNTPCSTGLSIVVLCLGFMSIPVGLFSQPSVCMEVCVVVCVGCVGCVVTVSVSVLVSVLLSSVVVVPNTSCLSYLYRVLGIAAFSWDCSLISAQ